MCYLFKTINYRILDYSSIFQDHVFMQKSSDTGLKAGFETFFGAKFTISEYFGEIFEKFILKQCNESLFLSLPKNPDTNSREICS